MPDERSVEVPWLLRTATQFPALDVGSAESRYLQDLAGEVDGVDLRPPQFPGLRHTFTADIRTWEAPIKYPTVIALSTVEHIGLACEPYGTPADDVADGDRKAVLGCMRQLAPGGTLLLTVPFGPEHENRGWYRVYSLSTLTQLLDGLTWYAEYHYHPEWQVGGVALVTATVAEPSAA